MHQLLRRADDVFEASVDDVTLLLNADTGRYHSLNPVAARIWDLLGEPVDEAGIVAGLLAEFDVAPDACRQAVSTFLTGLRERGLVTEA